VPYIIDNGNYKVARREHNHYVQGLINGIEFSELNEAIVKTPFALDNNGDTQDMTLVAGFLGISQKSETSALRPVLGWAIYSQ